MRILTKRRMAIVAGSLLLVSATVLAAWAQQQVEPTATTFDTAAATAPATESVPAVEAPAVPAPAVPAPAAVPPAVEAPSAPAKDVAPAVQAPPAEAVPGTAKTQPSPVVKAPSPQPKAVEAVNPLDERVELHVKDADLLTELRLLAEQHRLNIIAGKDVSGKVTADLYDVTIEQALRAILEMNGYGLRRAGDFIYVYTKAQLREVEQAEAKVETRTYLLNYINVDDAREVIKPALSKSAVVASTLRAKAGIPSGSDVVGGDDYGLQDMLVVTDFVDNQTKVGEILKKVDVRPKEVLVEATILQVTLDDDTSLGVDFNVLAGVDFKDITLASAMTVANPNAIAGTATATQAQIPFGRVGTAGFAPAGTGFQVGVMTNDVSVFVQALEEVKDVNVLSNPKVLALNKQRSEVLVGRRLGYRTTTTTTTSEVETIEFLDTGTQLQFRPFISDDGFIRMEVHPKVADGDISASGLPREETTEVTCNVMVRDGHTIVIGGLFDESTTVDKLQVPGLGNLPLVGALFRKDHQSTLRHEIIFLLTPHIIDHGVASVEGQETLEYMDRAATSLRNRFPLYTREKLTQLHLSEGARSYTRYLSTKSESDRASALWNLKLARHVAPNNREVYALLDKLEAEDAARRPRLRNESVLWKRMMEQGLVNDLPASGQAAK